MKLSILLHFYSRKNRMHFSADWMPISWNNFVHYFLSFLYSISLCCGANQKNYSLIDADSFACCVFYEFQGCPDRRFAAFLCFVLHKNGLNLNWVHFECTFFRYQLRKCVGECANYYGQTMTQITCIGRRAGVQKQREIISLSLDWCFSARVWVKTKNDDDFWGR